MAEAEETDEDEGKKPSKMPMIIGLVLALVGGGGGFYAVSSGLILGEDSHASAKDDGHGDDHGDAHGDHGPSDLGDIAYVAMDPVIVSLTPGSNSSHLKFRAQVEVESKYQSDVELIKPRITDVMNNYLRALETADLEAPAALMRVRAHLLRRIQIVAGPERVRDLLIMEFVLN